MQPIHPLLLVVQCVNRHWPRQQTGSHPPNSTHTCTLTDGLSSDALRLQICPGPKGILGTEGGGPQQPAWLGLGVQKARHKGRPWLLWRGWERGGGLGQVEEHGHRAFVGFRREEENLTRQWEEKRTRGEACRAVGLRLRRGRFGRNGKRNSNKKSFHYKQRLKQKYWCGTVQKHNSHLTLPCKSCCQCHLWTLIDILNSKTGNSSGCKKSVMSFFCCLS